MASPTEMLKNGSHCPGAQKAKDNNYHRPRRVEIVDSLFAVPEEVNNIRHRSDRVQPKLSLALSGCKTLRGLILCVLRPLLTDVDFRILGRLRVTSARSSRIQRRFLALSSG